MAKLCRGRKSLDAKFWQWQVSCQIIRMYSILVLLLLILDKEKDLDMETDVFDDAWTKYLERSRDSGMVRQHKLPKGALYLYRR